MSRLSLAPRRSGVLCLLAFLLVAAPCHAAERAKPAERAKNIILMISDGAGFNAFQAASYFEHGKLGKQPYDGFPVHLGCTTYMLNFVDAEGRP
ncbi:MAG: hypothetical protein U1E05_15285, partial [Patescibacteria group bacterium]|nr:hypothetical protein [Patescibacteria group bacterium]